MAFKRIRGISMSSTRASFQPSQAACIPIELGAVGMASAGMTDDQRGDL